MAPEKNPPPTLGRMDADLEPRAVDLRDYVLFDRQGASGRRALQTDVLAVDIVCLEPGQEVMPRTFATADVVYTVLGGIAWVVTDDAQVTLSPLQAIVIPADVPHALRNEGADPLILQALVSPPDDVAVPSGPAVPRDADAPASKPSALRRLLGGSTPDHRVVGQVESSGEGQRRSL